MIEAKQTKPAASRWGRVLLVLVGVKVAYWAVVLTAVGLWSDFDTNRAAQIQEYWFPAGRPSEPRGEWERHFATWDAEHYLYLSAAGYAAGVRSIAFYPLWPMVIRATAALTGLSHPLMGLVLANVCSLGGWLLFHRVTARRLGEKLADAALAVLVVFPGALFFQFLYSESLFFLLLMGLWWGLERRRYGVAWGAAFLAPLARGVGVFAVLPIGWHALSVASPAWLGRLQAWRGRQWEKLGARSQEPEGGRQGVEGRLASKDAGGGEKRGVRSQESGERQGSTESRPTRGGSAPALPYQNVGGSATASAYRPWALLAAPLVGWGCYLALMWHWTGNPFAGLEAQKYWQVHSIGNLWDVPKFVAGFFEVSAWHEFRGSVLDRCLFILLVYTLPMIWRLGKDMAVWTYVLGILPAMSGTFTSFTRFESCAFPLFIALAAFFTGWKRKWPLVLFIIFSATLHAVLLWRFVNFRWAG